MRSIRVGYPISGTPLVGDIDGDGRTEIVGGALAMGLWRLDPHGVPRTVAGWPQRGRGPFASSPACADLNGDGRPEIVAGSDDNDLHVWRLDGSVLPGFPYRTRGDVYSSPALADLNGDGQCEIVFGSDDGCVHAIDGRGRCLPGWPVRTGGFVSASPAVVDLDGDGVPEIIVGSWDRKLYVIRADGTLWSAVNGHPGWPVALDSILWSSPLVADLDGDGSLEIAVASEALHVLGLDGRDRPGWPQWIGGFTASSPACADLDGEGRMSLAVGGDGLHVFDSAGRVRRGFPRDLGGHVWARPLLRDLNGDGRAEIYVGSWSGAIVGLGGDGQCLSGFPIRTRRPIFGAVATNGSCLVVGSWDGRWRIFDPGQLRRPGRFHSMRGARTHASPMRDHPRPGAPLPSPSKIRWTISPSPPRAFRAAYVQLEGISSEAVRSALLVYRRVSPDEAPVPSHAPGDPSIEHPSPFLPYGGMLAAMFEPLPGGMMPAWHIEIEGWDGDRLRIPEDGEATLRVAGDAARDTLRALGRRLRRWSAD